MYQENPESSHQALLNSLGLHAPTLGPTREQVFTELILCFVYLLNQLQAKNRNADYCEVGDF